MASPPKKVPPANYMAAEHYRRSFYGFKCGEVRSATGGRQSSECGGIDVVSSSDIGLRLACSGPLERCPHVSLRPARTQCSLGWSNDNQSMAQSDLGYSLVGILCISLNSIGQLVPG